MRKSLLELDEVILRKIGTFLHEDNSIPLPSPNPHWLNLKSDISPGIGKDYRSLSNTCRRFKDLLPLKGLHLRLTKWYKLIKFMEKSPVSVLDGIRRLEIDIDQTEKLSQQSLFSKWLILSEFLSMLTSLEELIIITFPLCQHDQLKNVIKRHNTLLLPRLLSLSLQQSCTLCTTEWIHPFILSCPDLQTLRIVCKQGNQIFIENTVQDWKVKFKKSTHPLKQLIIKIDAEEECLAMIKRLSNTFEALRSLIISPHSPRDPGPLIPCLYLGIKRKRMGANWIYSLMENSVKVKKDLPETIQTQGIPFDEALKNISNLPNLEILDLGIRIYINKTKERPNPYSCATPNRGKSSSDYQKQLKNLRTKRREYQDYRYDFENAIISASRIMVEYFPNLQRVSFWELKRGSKDTSKEWNRWCCQIKKQNIHSLKFEVDPIPECTYGEWSRNLEGAGSEEEDHYHSDSSDE